MLAVVWVVSVCVSASSESESRSRAMASTDDSRLGRWTNMGDLLGDEAGDWPGVSAGETVVDDWIETAETEAEEFT